MARIATKFISFHAASACAGLLLVALLSNSAQASGLGYGATASGDDYITSELPGGTVIAEAALLYSVGGQGTTLAAGNGVSGAGSAADAPVYSYANLATGTLYATGDWSLEYVSTPNNLQVGPTIGQASLNDTILGFTNVPAGAIGQLVINAPLAEADGLGQVSEVASISSGAGGYGAGLTQTLRPTGATLNTSSTVAGACNCTTTGGWTGSVSLPFQIVAGTAYILEESVDAQTGEPNPIPLYPTPGVSLGVAYIDPTWSLILPAGVGYTTASGDLVGVAPVPLPRSVLMLAFGLSLLALIPRRRDLRVRVLG
jgi:hypothetical protein